MQNRTEIPIFLSAYEIINRDQSNLKETVRFEAIGLYELTERYNIDSDKLRNVK